MPLILVVDDHEWIRQPVQGILEEAGYEVVAKQSGPSALVYIESTLGSPQEPDVVVTDHSMPGMYGWEWVGWARKCGFKKKVILLSGKEPNEDLRKKYENVGVIRILLKPTTAEVLSAAVKSELAGAS